MYLGIRCLADIFPTAAIALIDAAIVIATRETSTGRGDVGRQLGRFRTAINKSATCLIDSFSFFFLAFGAIGLAAFGSLSGYLMTLLRTTVALTNYAPILLHAILMFIAACVALSANSMPLGPPEWWWHTRSGMLALPMSAVRKYGGETVALFVVLVLLGGFWSLMDSYLPMLVKNFV